MASDVSRNLILAVDLGGTKIQSSVVDVQGSVLSASLTLTEAQKGPGSVLEKIIFSMSDAMEKSRQDPSRVLAVGVGSPGPLDPKTGTIYSPPNLPGWDDICLSRLLQERTNLPCFVDNDVNMGTLGEHAFGAAKGAECALGVFLGTGIGGGIILNGKLHYGFNGSAGEVGHLVVLAGQAACNCGSNGCVEALASRTAMVKRMKDLLAQGQASEGLTNVLRENPDPPAFTLAKLYHQGDPIVVPVVDEASFYTGIALGSMINLISPEVIVLGGGVMEALWDVMSDKIQKHAFDHALPFARRGVRIVKAVLGDDAGVIGAATMARQRMAEIKDAAEAPTLILRNNPFGGMKGPERPDA